MKPTPEMIEVACKAHTPQFDRMDPDLQVYARQQMSEALSAALSVPAAAVVGEPVGMGVFRNGEMIGFVGIGDEFKLPEDKDERRPIYAAPSAPDGWQPISVGVYEAMVEALRPFATTDWADENGWTDIACQKDRIVDWFGPSEFFAASTAYLAYCNLSASRISQQDAELERLRREVEALRVLSFSGNALVQIVEGLQGSMEHGTWRDEKGLRLKDTNAWALFYTTVKASAQAAKAEETAR